MAITNCAGDDCQVRHVELDQAARSELDADAAAFRAQATLRTRYRTVDTHRPIPVMPLVVMARHSTDPVHSVVTTASSCVSAKPVF